MGGAEGPAREVALTIAVLVPVGRLDPGVLRGEGWNGQFRGTNVGCTWVLRLPLDMSGGPNGRRRSAMTRCGAC